MSTHDIRSRFRRSTLTQLLVTLSTALVLAFGFSAGTAQSTQDAEGRTGKPERDVQDKIPAHLPIKVKLKKSEKVKDLENDQWLADLEIEVTNTGAKPIYFIYFGVTFLDVRKDSGNEIGYTVQYGRPKMVDIGERATPEDVPIPPGGTHVFRLNDDYVKGWNWYRTQVERKPHPRRIAIIFGALNHGDGTGYLGTDGTPLPNRSSRGGSADYRWRLSSQSVSPPTPASYDKHTYLPAVFSPVNFFPAKSGIEARLGTGPVVQHGHGA